MFLLLKYPNKDYKNIYIIKKYDLPKKDFFQFSGSVYPTKFSFPRNTNNALSISGMAFFITSNLYFHKETHLKEIKIKDVQIK